MAPHSSTLAWKIPWTEEPGRLQSMGSLRVGHDRATSLSLFTIECYVGCGFVIENFYLAEICLLCTHFGKTFYYEWMLNFIKCFLGIFR